MRQRQQAGSLLLSEESNRSGCSYNHRIPHAQSARSSIRAHWIVAAGAGAPIKQISKLANSESYLGCLFVLRPKAALR
jgi:hypothetical protein